MAVHREHRRRGVARALVVDALAWMSAHPLTAAYVNTGVENAAALALYEDLGFERLDERLVIAARDIAAWLPALQHRRRRTPRRVNCSRVATSWNDASAKAA